MKRRLGPLQPTGLPPGVAAVFAAVLAAALGCGDRPEPVAELAVPHKPVPGGELVVAVQDDAVSLDPHAVTDAASMRMIENLYATLLRYGEVYGDLEADLAESIAVSDDRLVYTITLRGGARFHSGRSVTAEDVRYSIQRIIEKQVRAQHFEAVRAIETPDSGTVVLRLSRPMAPLLTYLAHPMNAMVDRGVIEATGGRLDERDAGAGPFRLVRWRRDQRLVLERFDGYHVPGRPYLDRVVIRPIPDETARSTAIRTGEVHLVTDIGAKDQRILLDAPGVVVESTPGTFWEYLGLNTRRPPLDDPRVRRAIAWAVDRSLLNKLVKFGQATPLTGGHLPPNHWAHASFELYPARDVARARALLAEAGCPGGFEAELIVGSAFAYQVQAGEVIKQQLADIGVAVTLRGLESSVFFDRLGAGDFDMTVVGWVGFVDPDQWMYELFHSDGRFNQQGYSDPRVDGLLERGRSLVDRAERLPIYTEAQRIIAHAAPMIFLYVNDQTAARLPRVQGFAVHPTAATLSLRDTWLVPR